MNELANILASNPALIQTGLDADTLAVAGGNGGNGKSISIKGGVFRKYNGGKEVGTIQDRHMNIIIVKMAHKASRMMFDKPFSEEDKNTSPTCWSTDSTTPDESVTTPQAASCQLCPHSIKGSGNNGTGTKCSLFWKTAVVLPNDPAGDVMELRLAATSVFGDEKNGTRPFRPYIQHLASHNVSAGRIITKMQFDLDATYPKVVFSPVSGVPAEHLDIIAEQAKSKDAERAITINVNTTKTPAEIAEIDFMKSLATPAPAPAPVVPQATIVPQGFTETVETSQGFTEITEAPQVFAEPVVRVSKPATEQPTVQNDVADIVKKWSTT